MTAKNKEYRYYLRRYSSTIEAKGEDERELIRLTAQVPYDDRVNQNATTADLSPRLMEEFLREVGSGLVNEVARLSVEALGRQMRVVTGPSEAPLPQNVGLLFFNEHPERFFPVTQIDVVWFPEGEGGDRFEEKIFMGPLGRITRDTISFIQRNYLKETIIKHPQRAEAERFWDFPQAAIEEAVVNAIYHRSYEIREPVEVRISSEDLVVLSFPGLDRSIRLKDLNKGKAVSRRYRNRRIGEFLKELDLTEGRSTGISKIIKAMAINGSPAPEFETNDERSYFLIRLPVHEKAANGEGHLLEPSSEKILGDRAGQILEMIRLTPTISAGVIAMELGISSRAVEKQIAKLKDLGWILRVGSDRDGTWEVLNLSTSDQQTIPQFGGNLGKDGSVETLVKTDHVTPEVSKILRILEGEMNRQEIMTRLELRDEKHFREHYQQVAIASGVIEMTVPDKPKSRFQKYRLTEAGQRWLAKNHMPWIPKTPSRRSASTSGNM